MKITVEGLSELRRDLKRAQDASPKELTRALKVAGRSIPPRMKSLAPQRSGQLRGAIGNPLASGTKGRIPVKVPHAIVAEFKKSFGSHGSPPRFGYRALEQQSEEVIRDLEDELKDILTAYGWLGGS